MKNTLENKDLETVFQHLASIKTVEPRENLYLKIHAKIQKKNNMIPMVWVRAAACLLFIFVSAETVYLLKETNKTETQLSELMSLTNNNLYDE